MSLCFIVPNLTQCCASPVYQAVTVNMILVFFWFTLLVKYYLWQVNNYDPAFGAWICFQLHSSITIASPDVSEPELMDR